MAIGGFNAANKPEVKIMQLSLAPLDIEWKVLSVTLPKPVVNPGIQQVGGDRLIIFGGWNNENLKTIFILKEAQSTFTLKMSKHSMETGDVFLVNGVVRNDGT